MKRILMAALAAALLAGAAVSGPAASAAEPAAQTVTPASAIPSVSAGSGHFTGRVRMETLFGPAGTFTTYGAGVTFEPGARTHWHIHHTAQVLIVTAGAGYVGEWGRPPIDLRAGDVVFCPPEVKHWPGAGPKTAMTHIAISQTGSDPVTWLEPVADSLYPEA